MTEMMRNKPVSGFVLHQRAYRETSRLVYFFSQEFGLLHAVARQQPSQFQHINALASGKGDLKRLTHVETGRIIPQIQGQALYAGMYANELLIKLLAQTDPMPNTFCAYEDTLLRLANIHADNALLQIKMALRFLELTLLTELGYAINFHQDVDGHAFMTDKNYQYLPSVGFAPCLLDKSANTSKKTLIAGSWLCQFDEKELTLQDIYYLGIILRACIDYLLDYKPLKSRALWISLYQPKKK